jgi:hypothetical protein
MAVSDDENRALSRRNKKNRRKAGISIPKTQESIRGVLFLKQAESFS